VRIKTTPVTWIDFGPRIMQSMDRPLNQAMFHSAHALDAGRHEADGPTDLLATLYAGLDDSGGRIASVRKEE
jgi:hypothetical protein